MPIFKCWRRSKKIASCSEPTSTSDGKYSEKKVKKQVVANLNPYDKLWPVAEHHFKSERSIAAISTKSKIKLCYTIQYTLQNTDQL